MTATKRTDAHRPSVVNPAEYVWVSVFDRSEDGMSPSRNPHAREEAAALGADIDKATGFDGHFVTDGRCDSCGSGNVIVVGVEFLHAPTNQSIVVGSLCAEVFGLDSREQAAARRDMISATAEALVAPKRAKWFAINPDREAAFQWASYMVERGEHGYENMRATFVGKVARYGSTSDKFVSAILRDMVRGERVERERAAERELLTDVVAGQGVEIVGEVVSAKLQENDYGTREVMTVKDDRGFLVWGSVPNVLSGIEKGYRVRFVANVEASERDASFGFFKRPRGGDILPSLPRARVS